MEWRALDQALAVARSRRGWPQLPRRPGDFECPVSIKELLLFDGEAARIVHIMQTVTSAAIAIRL
jgi:hypothetical protein